MGRQGGYGLSVNVCNINGHGLKFTFFHIRYIAGYQNQLLAHGVMMIGPSGSGKSLAWKVLPQGP